MSSATSSLLDSFGFSDDFLPPVPGEVEGIVSSDDTSNRSSPSSPSLDDVITFLVKVDSLAKYKDPKLKRLRKQIGRLSKYLDEEKFLGKTEEEVRADTSNTSGRNVAAASTLPPLLTSLSLTPSQYSEAVYKRKTQKALAQRMKADTRRHIETTALRAGRISSLHSLTLQQSHLDANQLQYMIPDGVGDLPPGMITEDGEPKEVRR